MKPKLIKQKLIKGTFVLLFIITSSEINSQNYLISFTGAGASPDVDSVFIENLMQGTTLKMKGSEILSLTLVTDVEKISSENRSDILLYPNPV